MLEEMRNSLSRSSVIACALLVLAGCTTVGPDYESPELDLETAWPEEVGGAFTEELTQENPRWWEAFNDDALTTLVGLAYRQNLDLRTAGLRIYEARALLGVAFGDYYPQSSLSGSGTTTQQSEHASLAPLSGDTTYSVGFDSSWELDIWGRNRRSIESANASYLSSVASYDDLLVSITAEVVRTYIQYRTLEQRITLARENIKLQERSLAIATVWFENGGKTELDVQQAKALLHDTRALVPSLELDLNQVENALAVLLGTTKSKNKSILASTDSAIPVGPEQVALSVPADLVRRRPDVRYAELQAISQSAEIGIATADLYPSFSLTGSVGFSVLDGIPTLAGGAGGSTVGDLFSSDSLTYAAGGGFSWPVFNFGRIRNNIRANDARFEQAIETYRNTVLTAVQEVQDASIAFIKTREREAYLRSSVEAYARATELSQLQYKDGEIDYQSVLDSLRGLVEKQQTHIQIKGDIATNLVAMYKALGGGWQLKHDDGVVPATTLERMRKRTDWGELLNDTGAEESEPPMKGKHFPRPDL
ncbi:MAG: efflux transporter outer membrane subunit [Candidatus Thiodiazotropha sp. (ex Lucinoma borealis)]|nr:efflux transporter outer membrane subunit [Candidatus Thiodiazotropha sp. (ex Lucinoma borealis)]